MSERRTFTVQTRGIGRKDYSQNVERYDVQPEILLQEGFENLPPHWITSGSAGFVVARNTTIAWVGGACLELTPPLGVLQNATYEQLFGLVPSLKLRVDLRVRFPTFGAGGAFRFGLRRHTGTQLATAELSYDPDANVWSYLNANGVYANIPGGAQNIGTQTFHHVTLVVDFQNSRYMYAIVNELFMDMQGLQLFNWPDALGPRGRVHVQALTTGLAAVTFYIDNVRVMEVI